MEKDSCQIDKGPKENFFRAFAEGYVKRTSTSLMLLSNSTRTSCSLHKLSYQNPIESTCAHEADIHYPSCKFYLTNR